MRVELDKRKDNQANDKLTIRRKGYFIYIQLQQTVDEQMFARFRSRCRGVWRQGESWTTGGRIVLQI